QPGAGPGFHARALAGVREVLARRAARDDVHGLDGGPVDLRHVTEVRGVLVAVREDARRVSVELRHPRNVGVEHGLHGEVEAAVSREKGTDAERCHHGTISETMIVNATPGRRTRRWSARASSLAASGVNPARTSAAMTAAQRTRSRVHSRGIPAPGVGFG